MRYKLKKRWIKKYLRMNHVGPAEEPKVEERFRSRKGSFTKEEINTEKTTFEVTDTDISVLFSQTHSESGEFQFIRSGASTPDPEVAAMQAAADVELESLKFANTTITPNKNVGLQ
jgi:hypothetical protein